MRRGTCLKCEHNHILHLTQIADQVGDRMPKIDEGLEPRPTPGQSTAWRIARLRNPDNPRQSLWSQRTESAGVVEAFVCRRCGYTELYTRDAGAIPIDGETVREIVGPEPVGPYR